MPDAGSVDSGSPDAGPGHSRGTGKLPCTRTGTVNTVVGARPYCVARVGGVELKVIEPDDVATSQEPLQLALYLHGDGARPYVNDTALRLQAPWTVSHHVLYAAVLAPNACAWWTKPNVDACDAGATLADRDLAGDNARTLEAVIVALRAGWDVLDAPILFGGSSGGSIFLSADFLPRFGATRPGLYVLNCGGELPWVAPSAGLAGVRLSFSYGTLDFLVPDILSAQRWFTDAGVPWREQVFPNADHCAYDHLGLTTQLWDAGQ